MVLRRIRYWDLSILVPNLLFLLFLILKCGNVIRKVRTGNSPVLRAFTLLVYVSTLVNIVRCVYSMTLSMTEGLEETVDQTLWIVIKFFYLTAELSALTFGLLFGHLDNGKSILVALLGTMLISIPHTAVQIIIEMKIIDNSWLPLTYFDIQSDGGFLFWVLSSAFLALTYFSIMCLPLVCCQKYTKLPSKGSFLIYCMLMVVLNLLQSLGATLILFKSSDGLCFVGVSTYVYFVMYPPIIYFTFLRKKLKTPPNNTSGLFMYRKHKDEQGSGDLPESYYPRFSGLTSPSYDDLFDYDRDARFTHYDISTNQYVQNPHYNTYSTPLIMSSVETAESTVTTRTGSDDYAQHRDSMLFEHPTGTTTRHLKGLGPHGGLVFEDEHHPVATFQPFQQH
uniref:Transmembrane protein adipocyte-associated 1 homolog n=5 Tax=Caenorhabditis japonica TaxID=281687 RepID=A0A8R1HK76_CAEJA